MELDRKGEFVFTGRNGKAVLNRGQLEEVFRSARKASGIKDFRIHDLRHTFASNLVMQEGSN